MTGTIRLVAGDPILRLIAIALGLIGAVNASVFPYQSLIAISRLGMADGTYAVVLFLASVLGVSAAVGVGIVTDQRANRRQMALLAAAAMVAGPAAMLLAPGMPAFILCHGLMLPLTASLIGQLFALVRLRLQARPESRPAVLSALRAMMSLTFLIVLPLWSLAAKAGVDVMHVYVIATVAATVLFAVLWNGLPRDGQATWADPLSGLSAAQSLREIARLRILARIGLLGAITAAPALYMVLIGLVFHASAGRTDGDVALFVGLVAGWEVPFMLLLPILAARLSRTTLIALGGATYAAYLALLPVLAPTAAAWLLPVLAGLGGAAILTQPILYLQDQMHNRPGTGSSLMAVQKVCADTICAAVFAFGSYAGGYGLVAILGAGVALLGALGLVWIDRRAGDRHGA